VKALKSAVTSRPRAATAGSKGIRSGKKRRKGDKTSSVSSKSQIVQQKDEHWGILEPFRGTFGPIVSIFKPFAGTMAVVTIVVLLCIIWLRRPVHGPAEGTGYLGYSGPARLAAYEEMWQREESELWSWLEDRVGLDGLALKDELKGNGRKPSRRTAKARSKDRQKILASKNMEARLREEHMTDREMEDAIRVTQERLDVLKGVMEKKKSGSRGAEVVKDSSKE
jgi:hypothetical protein